MKWKNSVEEWLNHPQMNKELKNELKHMSDQEQEDAFSKTIKFGTAGMRGVMGPGTNRMNIYMVREVTDALAKKLAQNSNDAEAGVVIAFDSRHHSKEFAQEAAATLATQGVKVYLFEECRPTPELSFAVRHLKAAAGIMITASHNPAEYNGYKIYNHLGGQLLPSEVDELLAFIDNEKSPINMDVDSFKNLLGAGKVEMIGENLDSAYIKMLMKVNINTELIKKAGDRLKIVFTPLHGTGQTVGVRALNEAGFSQLSLVESQATPDPDFSTVKSPNPESNEAFSIGIEQGKKEKADVVLATDPDADRIGIAVTADYEKYQILTGNQLAALLIHYILFAKKAKNQLSGKEQIITSVVSSTLPARIAADYNVSTNYVLTGFKYIAEKIEQDEENFLFGFEESMGYLYLPFVRDKDAIQIMLLVSEMLLAFKEEQSNAIQELEQLYETYGYSCEKTLDFKFPEQEKMEQLLENLRDNLPQKIAGLEVEGVEDYLTGQKITNEDASPLEDFPEENLLRFELESGSWVAVRPSGTEPKLKVYIAGRGDTQKEAEDILKMAEKDVTNLVKTVA